MEVRHILFKKIVFLIFLNNRISPCQAAIYCLTRSGEAGRSQKEKNKKPFFSFQSMPNLNFAKLQFKSTGFAGSDARFCEL